MNPNDTYVIPNKFYYIDILSFSEVLALSIPNFFSIRITKK
jgi:hypothetical protein